MRGNEYQVSSVRVLELAAQSKCSAYDCQSVALAIDLGLSLATGEARTLRAFPEIAVGLDRFAPGQN